MPTRRWVQKVETIKSDDAPISSFEYAYDANGRRTSMLEADGSRVTWTYDSISQVTSEWRTGTNAHRHTFTYDKVGNRTLKIEDGARTTYVYDLCNQLNSAEDAGGTTNYAYDMNGNQTVAIAPSGARTTQVWDYENRLVKTIQPSLAVTSMAYDADGLRLKKEEPGKTTLFVWDDQNYLEETDAAGTTEKAYTTEPSTYGSLISHRAAGASTFYHFDALAATRALTDESESVLERYNYTAFGTLLGTPTLLTPFLWGGLVGYYWDAALGTNYIRARHYQPTIARWLTLDPIGFAGGDANLFRYVGNSPTSGPSAMRLRLTSTSFGDMYAYVAAGGLRYVFGGMHEGFKGASLRLDLVMYPDGENSHTAWFALDSTDPTGLAHDSVTGTIEKCLRLPTLDEKIACLETLLGLGDGKFDKALQVAKCLAIYGAYKHLGCKACKGGTTTKEESITNAACWATEIAGRELYLAKRCDYILPDSIVRGSAVAEAGHRKQVKEKAAPLARCLCWTGLKFIAPNILK